jgi:lipoate-protein ligase A
VAGMTLVESFAFFDRWTVECLRALGVPAGYRPINDIVSARGKIGGAAQARRRGAVLHHTTIAFDIDPELVPCLIRIGREPVSPRGVRSAAKTVSPLSWFLELPLGAVVEQLIGCFQALYQASIGTLTDEELTAARELAMQKYARPEWVDRL